MFGHNHFTEEGLFVYLSSFLEIAIKISLYLFDKNVLARLLLELAYGFSDVVANGRNIR